MLDLDKGGFTVGQREMTSEQFAWQQLELETSSSSKIFFYIYILIRFGVDYL